MREFDLKMRQDVRETSRSRKLGQHGPDVFPIGIGAMSFAPFYGEVSEADSHGVLEAAMELGVNYIDTANIYGMGQSENFIGSFLKSRGNAAKDFFRIATKAGIARGHSDGPFINTLQYLRSELESSLVKLGLERVDLFYIHRRDHQIPIEDVAGTMGRLIEEGKIASYGFSEIAPTSLIKAHEVQPVAAIQSEYSLLNRGPDLGIVQASERIGAAMVAFSPLGRSLLTDKPHDEEAVAIMPFLRVNPRFLEPNLSANHKAGDGFRHLAASMGMPASCLALAWLLHRGEHVIPIPGTRSAVHFRELIAAANIRLTEEDMAMIDQVMPPGWAHGDRYSDEQWLGVERYW